MICPGTIKKGSVDPVAVKSIKVRLNELLGSNLDVHNANFGDSTEQLVKIFQKQNQLIQDGIIGDLTWERLFTISTEEKPISKILRFRALEIMDTQLHVREKTGKNDGVEVEAYLKSVGLPKSYAWCMAFVYWSFDKASKELNVKNPVPKTAGVLDCFAKAKVHYEVKIPMPGDQFIMDFGKGAGHTGLVGEVRGNKIFTIEGNTSADPAYAAADREGNGVFERSRSISSIKGFLRYA